MYAAGDDVPEDDAEAVRWYRLAAEQGDAIAQVRLGWMYAYGEGGPEDDVLAYMWWHLAAAQGDEAGQNNKARAEEMMTREQIAEAQRLSREWLEAHPPGTERRAMGLPDSGGQFRRRVCGRDTTGELPRA
jgi:TPR repeat protein